MKISSDKIIKSILGQDFFEELKKSDVLKIHSNVATSVDEMAIGLKIVPRTVMSFLMSNLTHLPVGGNVNVSLPFTSNAYLQVTKMDRDNYTGHIYAAGKKVNEFANRSIPGLGLVLMTTFELYNLDSTSDFKQKEEENFDTKKLQELIDQRLLLHNLANKVIKEQMMPKEAINTIIKEKISQALSKIKHENKVSTPKKQKTVKQESKPIDSKRKISEEEIAFIVDAKENKQLTWDEVALNYNTRFKQNKSSENVKKSYQRYRSILNQKIQKNENNKMSAKTKEQSIMIKNQKLSCPDCGASLYDNSKHLTLCICYGEDWGKEIKINKSENNMNMVFPKNVDKENLEMLLKTLKKINKG
jgi:hypothetical protein